MNDVTAWRPRLLTGHWFAHLPPTLQDSVLAAARVRRLPAGACLFQRGDAPCGLYAVVEGSMRIGAVNAQGKEALLALVEAPQWFGEIALFDGQLRTHDAYAEDDCVLVWVPQGALLAMLAATPAWWRDFALLMSQKLRLAFVMLEHPQARRNPVAAAEGGVGPTLTISYTAVPVTRPGGRCYRG